MENLSAFENKSPDELLADVDNTHPALYYIIAAKLMCEGRLDEAVFWYYIGQLRYRIHLAARPELDPTGDPALFASFTEVIGRPINEYAFGDINAVAATIDKVLMWDDEHPDGFTPKGEFADERENVREGLKDLRSEVLAEADEIRQKRKEHGLENRSE
jgi:hypothetical protein